jgi:hypothetical protein
MRVTGIPTQNFNLKIEGKMAFWAKIYIDNEGKNVIGCIYLMKISISNL